MFLIVLQMNNALLLFCIQEFCPPRCRIERRAVGMRRWICIGVVGDCGVRGTAQQPRLFVGMILILIFAEVLGLYGLIVALILSTKG